MPFGLLKYGFSRSYPVQGILPAAPELKKSYDVVIIGAGGHGLAAAYYLAKDHGVHNIAVFDKGYIGGDSAHDSGIIRCGQQTPAGLALFRESLALWQTLPREFAVNPMVSERGHLTLAHNESSLRKLHLIAETGKHLGIDYELVDRDELARLCPLLNLPREAAEPILGALHHPSGATAHPDAVSWGYAQAAAKLGVAIHPYTEVTAIHQDKDKVSGIETLRGRIACGKVLQTVAGGAGVLAKSLDLRLPIRTFPRQACVSMSIQPLLDPVVISDTLQCSIWQTAHAKLVISAENDAYPLYSTRTTLECTEQLMAQVLTLFPSIGELRIQRQWAGLIDQTPDSAPLLGMTPVENFYIDAGWGGSGFQATPVCGKTLAACMADNRQPALLEPFRWNRFQRFRQHGTGVALAVDS